MPAVFNLAALLQPQAQMLSLPQAAKSTAQFTPPGQSSQGASTTPSGAAPFGAGAPMATAAALPPSGLLPTPAPPPVVSTSQTGRLAAAAINGLDRQPDQRPRDQQQQQVPRQSTDSDPRRTRPSLGARGEATPPRGIPGGPAPAAKGGDFETARAGYLGTLFAL
ncbi:hypothetical protein [Antarctobacter jejuensis]|uniref:hypothetical protein n=1 Tax=Antarctobacter jejuensis TaxID=1439938 RepID=UPI003FD4D2B0